MSFYAAFIGVGRHTDPQIRELVGASRDAVALHALFSDSAPEIEALLLVDADATAGNIRSAFADTLGRAGSEDTVVLFFSGHGTHDHRLATFDTVLSDLPHTTIAMDELVASFKQTNARAVLCILDCCFSGGAPGKVLEDSPIPRDPATPFESIAGEGRVLLTASAANELAYESPGSRHGLLTKALLEVLCNSAEPLSLLTAVDRVLEYVRAEASRMGIRQNPVMFGTVAGGLMLPNLTPGSLYRAAFPEFAGVLVTATISDLRKLGFPSVVVDTWANRYPNGLNDLQLSAVNGNRIADGNSLLVVAPTSSGKTFIGEIAAARSIAGGRKAAFLLPYKALVNEKHEQFSSLYGEILGMRVIRCTGDYSDETSEFVKGKYDLAILTYEMFLGMIVSNPAILHQVGLVVLDEAQFVTDPSRGITVELLLTFLLSARERGVSPQIVALSAVIGDVNAFHTWLGCELLQSEQRPVPLIEGVIDRSGAYKYVDTDGQSKIMQLVAPSEVRIRTEKPSAQDLIVPLVRRLASSGEKVIIFRNQRGTAQGCAGYLARELGLPGAAAAVELLPTHDNSASSAALRTCLLGGTAFHSSNLTREEKLIVEQAFRDPTGPVRVLAATTTVAAGINTPASTVILAEQEFLGEDGRPFTVAEYKNMAGRAGRLGFQEQGKAIIYAESSLDRDQLFRRYVIGELESLKSSFDARHLDTWVLRLLAQVRSVPREDVIRLLANTYAGYLESRRSPSWRVSTKTSVDQLLGRMAALGLLETEGDRVRLTLLGRACGRSSLSFASAMRLVEALRTLPPDLLLAKNLMAIIQVVPEAGGFTPLLKRGAKESVRIQQASARYGRDIVSLLQRHADDIHEYYGRCKRSAILADWISGRPMEEIERDYSTTPFSGKIEHGDIRRFADNAQYILRSANEILAIILGGTISSDEIEALLTQIEIGLPADGLDLTRLPVSMTRGEYLALYNAGIRSVSHVWATSTEVLRVTLGKKRAVEVERFRSAIKSAPA
jgi:helicase